MKKFFNNKTYFYLIIFLFIFSFFFKLYKIQVTKQNFKNIKLSISNNVKELGLEKYNAKKDYRNIENDVYYKATLENLNYIIENKKDAIVYIGFPSCPWCVYALPCLDNVNKDFKMEIITINLRDDINKNNVEEFNKLKTLLPEIFSIKDNQPYIYSPYVLFIKHGKLLFSHVGTIINHNAKASPLSYNDTFQLVQKYKNGFNLLYK